MTENQRLYYEMLRIRKIEEEIALKYKDQEMRLPVHLSIWQEAPAVAMCSLLGNDDLMVSTHRGHAHYLAKGGSLNGLISELYGKEAGCSRGQGGSMHLIDLNCGFHGSTSIVGGTIPIGVGLAFAKKLKGEPGRVVICMGDAAVEQGVFHESANFARLHNLPVIFLCENNRYSCYTNIESRQPSEHPMRAAIGHKIKYIYNDSNDVYFIKKEIEEWLEFTDLPLFIELETYRKLEHCGPNNDDHLDYRPVEERERWFDRDCLFLAKEHLRGIDEWTQLFVNTINEAIESEIIAAFDHAQASPPPTPRNLEYANS